jgi:hypothetical protein
MTYLEILRYQERTMRDLLSQPFYGFRGEREAFKFNVYVILDQIRKMTRQ